MRTRLIGTLVLSLFGLVACSGGSSSGTGDGSTTDAPSDLTYSVNPATYPVGVTIPANTPSSSGGAVVTYSVSPALPAGLSLDTSTGLISGTPSAVTATATYTVTATNSAGSATASVAITVTAGTAARITKIAGDAQTAPLGTAVAIAPEVAVMDSGGNPVPGVTVSFVVTAGGGSVQSSLGVTSAEGRASCGAWTLGSTFGSSQTLSASIAGVAGVTFSATAVLRNSADIQVSLWAPSIVGASFDVSALVDSAHPLAGVSASIGAGSVPLTQGSSRYGPTPFWRGTLSTAGMLPGTISVVVTATDVLGSVTDAVVLVRFDPLPVVTVSSPSPEAVARPSLAVSAACTDDAPAGCTSITVAVNGTVLLSGGATLTGDVDLSAYEGQEIDLTFTGKDSSDQLATVTRHVYVESSAKLAVQATVPGHILDCSGTRVLYAESTETTSIVRLLDTSGDTRQDIALSEDVRGKGEWGFLTPMGAIYAHSGWIYEWRNGTLTNLGYVELAGGSLKASGNYAIFNQGWTLLRRDLVTGTNATIATDALWDDDIAANGDVVYSTNGPAYNVYWWRGGVTKQLSFDAAESRRNAAPLTDGALTVYLKCSVSPEYAFLAPPCDIVLNDGTSETLLAPSQSMVLGANRGYAIIAGHVTYTREDLANTPQVWRHTERDDQQLTFFESYSRIDGVSGDGTVLIVNGSRRYRAVPGSALEDVSSSLGWTINRAGTFYVIIGDTVFRLLP